MAVKEFPISVSVIVEWYNMSYAELKRPKQMLAALQSEAAALHAGRSKIDTSLSPCLELIVVFNSDAVVASDIQTILKEGIAENDWKVRAIPVAGAKYCQMKNAGAAVATGDLIIFLDCDVVPEPGWLAAFLKAFADPNVAAAVGSTYTDYSDGATYSKAMALTWMFPLRETDDGLQPCTSFYSNNTAFRKEVFLSRQFPDAPGLTHFPAALLVDGLERDGIPIWLVGGARASHPPPNGVRHFMARAIAGGRARVFSGERSARSALSWLREDISTMLYHLKRTVVESPKVGLRWWQIPGAIVYALTYDALLMWGSILSVTAPALMRNRFVL